MSQEAFLLLDLASSPVIQGGLLLLLALFLIWRSAISQHAPQTISQPIKGLAHAAAAAQEDDHELALLLGRGSAGGVLAADSVAAMAVARQAQAEALPDSSTRVASTVLAGDPTLWLAARQVQPMARFVGPDAATFAAGVRMHLESMPKPARVPCGSIGDEYLLLAEPGTWNQTLQPPAAVSTPTVLPFLLLTANQPALGDELYQAGTLLDEGSAAPTLPLMTQSRLILLLAILALATLRLGLAL